MAKNDYHIFVENGKVGMKDATDRVVLFAVYDGINFTDTETPICVSRDGKWGLVDVNGRTITDAKYDHLFAPCSERMLANVGDRWGFLDNEGKEIIPLIYEGAKPFTDAEYCFGTPCAWVQKDGKWGTINLMGDIVIPFEYDSAEDHNGNVYVEKDGKRGIINHKNEFLVPLGDDEICFLDYDIVTIYNDSMHYEMNLATMERIERDYRVETIFMGGKYAVVHNNGEKTFIKWIAKNVAKNVIDKNFNVLLPEWHEDIILLDNDRLLLFDQNDCYLYDMASGKSMECQHDENYVFLPDGKTMYCLNQLNDAICVKAGIKNLAWFAHDEGDIMKTMMLYELKTMKFKEGVTTIGNGWDKLGEQPLTYTPQVDIYLPSTLKEVNPEAFSEMITSIQNVYVPYGMGETMRSILPSHLHPFIKERSKGLCKLFEEPSILNWTDYANNPPEPDTLLKKYINKILPTNNGCLSFISSVILPIVFGAALWGIAFFGYYLAERTILPFDNITIKTVLSILIVSAICPILIFPFVRNNSQGVKNLFKSYFTTFIGWSFALFMICGFILLLFFGANKYIGGSEPQYTNGIVTNISTTDNGYSGDVKVQEFDTEYSLGSEMPFQKGENIKVKYHKGLFGFYVIDEFELRD